MRTEWAWVPDRDRTVAVAQYTGAVPQPKPGNSQPTSRAWLYWLAGAAAASLAYLFLPARYQVHGYDLIGLCAAGAMFVGFGVNRPEPRPAWFLIAVGVTMLVGGDIAYGIYERIPSVADMLYVSGYAVFAIGLIGMLRGRSPDRDRSALVDIVAIGTAVLVASLVFVGIAYSNDVGLVAQAVTISYPIMDLILFGLVVWLATMSEGSRTCHWFLGAALLLMMGSDMGYMLQNFGAQYSGGTALDLGWLLSYAFFGAALLHPSIASRRTPQAAGHTGTPARFVSESYGSVTALQAIRVRRVLKSTGLMSLGIAALAVLAGVGWRTPEVVLLAGVFGTIGSLSVIGSALSSA